ncbi:MAG: hypothetical protein KAI79_10845, partial [Bacteroidales bacterium]|nr:hypothetical protein [Bacteroidales bacterium]
MEKNMLSVEQILQKEHPKMFQYPKLITKPSISFLQLLFHEQQINNFLTDNPKKGIGFIDAVLEHLNISYKTDNREILNVPSLGKCIVVANHPLGALDALVLIQMLISVRQDTKIKIVANALLAKLKPLEELIIPVDNMSGKLTKTSLKMIDESLQ